MNRLRNIRFWRWLTTPDPSPGLSAGKIGKLLFKSFLFALVAVTLQGVLRALGVPFVGTTWGSLLVVLIVYIPFARLLSVDFMPPPRTSGRSGGNVDGRGASSAKGRAKSGDKLRLKRDKRKFAGVKKSGPRF